MNNKLLLSKVVENGVTDRLMDQLSIFDHLYEVATEESVDDIFIVGDVFDRSLVDAVTLTHTVEAISKTPVMMNIIAGNHDAASMKGGRFTVEAFGAMKNKNVRLLHGEYKPKKWLKFVSIPFMPVDDTNEVIKKYGTVKNADAVNVLLFHNSVLGCDHLEWTCDDGLDPDDMLDRFDYAIGGHFHEHQTFGRDGAGMYCGAPMHHNFGDAGRKAGFWLASFTKKGMKKKFIPSRCPKFHVIESTDKKTRQFRAGDYVRLEVKCTNAEWTEIGPEYLEYCESMENVNAHVKHKPVYHHKKRLAVADSNKAGVKLSLEKAITEYIGSGDVVLDGLKPDILKKIGHQVLSKVRAEHGNI